MSKKKRVRVYLSDTRDVKSLSDQEIACILRAANDVIYAGGRSLLTKILKGSKDKKLLEKGLQCNPSYGAMKDYTLEEIKVHVDWMIKKGFLCIQYSGRLPLLVFTEKGEEIFKIVYRDELYDNLLHLPLSDYETWINKLNKTGRPVVVLLLKKIGESKNISFIPFLQAWHKTEVKKVKKMINNVISQLTLS
jgi:superfamily II DNA helicase RecQ